MIITYTAKRNLASGHTSGTIYSLTFNVSSFVEARKRNRKTNDTLDGTTYGVTHYVKKKFTFKTQVFEGTDLNQFREFIDSVDYGETFTITDPDTGTVYTVYLDSWTPGRVLKKLNAFKYSLTVITKTGTL
jgi:hypothetical protein